MSKPTQIRPGPVADVPRARQVLRSTPVFASLSVKIHEALANTMAPRDYSAGQILCTEGDAGSSLFVLETGWVKAVRMTEGGREQAVNVMRDGEVFGAETVFTQAPYPLTVIALESVTAWRIDGAALTALVSRHPPLAVACLEHLGTRARYYIQLVEDLSLRSVPARLASTLLSHAESRDGQFVVPRRAWTTLDEMAARLGTVRDVLSRAISTLEGEGLLRLERDRIILVDPKKLLDRGRA